MRLTAVAAATLILGACVSLDQPLAPAPAEGCYPNHSGVCEGPPLTEAEMHEVQDMLRRIQARDTTEGRKADL